MEPESLEHCAAFPAVPLPQSRPALRVGTLPLTGQDWGSIKVTFGKKA